MKHITFAYNSYCFTQKLHTQHAFLVTSVTPGHRGDQLKNYHSIGKGTNIWHLVLLGKNVLFKESPPSIMVTKNPNWSTEILWFGTGYVKGKILSPLKRSA